MSQHRVLVAGVSAYPPPVKPLKAVAADVREVARLLGSPDGGFEPDEVLVLADSEASRVRLLAALDDVFRSAGPDDTVFVYLAGHGGVQGGGYYFYAHDTNPARLPETGVPLAGIKGLFDGCRSRRVFLWLDCCHSGGILARDGGGEDDAGVIERTLKVVQGHGKVILAACTDAQYAYEDHRIGHGLFTAYLLEGLKGGAAHAGEVTANSLFDFIDRRMGSDRQRPMMFGQATGRIVLMDYSRHGQPGHAAQPQPSAPPPPPPAGQPCSSSGSWVMLGTGFFEAQAVREGRDGTFTVALKTRTPEEDAAVQALRPGRAGRGDRVPFAYRHDAFLVRVTALDTSAAGDEQVWSFSLTPEDVQYGGGASEIGSLTVGGMSYSAEDIATLRARKLLLDESPDRTDGIGRRLGLDTLASHVRGHGTLVPVERCVLKDVLAANRDRPEAALKLARLACIFALKAGAVAEQVLELTLGPVQGGRCPVHFRGRRRPRYSNEEPAVVEVRGVCPLG